MPNSLQPASRHTLPRTLMAGFVLAALATLLIAFVNVRSAETRTRAVKAMDRATETVASSACSTRRSRMPRSASAAIC